MWSHLNYNQLAGRSKLLLALISTRSIDEIALGVKEKLLHACMGMKKESFGIHLNWVLVCHKYKHFMNRRNFNEGDEIKTTKNA